MKKFDWDYFINCEDIIAVHCDTEEKAKRFCNLMHEHGLKWRDGTSCIKENFWNVHKDKTCYDNTGRFGNIDNYTKYNDIILDFDSFIFDECDKSDEKDSTEVINAVKYLDRVKELTGKIVKVSIDNKLFECNSDCGDCLFDSYNDCTRGYINWLIEPYHENLIKKRETKD